MKTKKGIRKEITEKLKNQNQTERQEKSLIIKGRLFALPEFKQAKVIMFYVSTDFEVDTRYMIDDAFETGKNIAVPYVLEEKKRIIPSLIKDRTKDLVEGPYGIYQPGKDSYRPLPLSEIDLVIVPGIAFTKSGKRLGRGAGYYDRFLKELPEEIPTVGIAFGSQLVSDLPCSKQDIPVKTVITEL